MKNCALETTFLEYLTQNATKKILNNMQSQQSEEMVFNTTQLNFNFDSRTVSLSYFIEDANYADIKYSFEQFAMFLTANKAYLK